MLNESLDHAIVVLNRMLNSDRKATEKLFSCRIGCNSSLAEDPTIQVSIYQHVTAETDGEKHTVGILGLINGLFGADDDGYGYICTEHDVVCPDANHPKNPGGARSCGKGYVCKVGDNCPTCGEKLILGPLVRFARMPSRKKQKGDDHES